jgi:steroid delta-isomerase-like uncharacterized protein
MEAQMRYPLSIIAVVLLLCFTVSCQNKAEKAELEKVKGQRVIEEQNKQVARDFFAAIDRQDFTKLKELLADDFALSAPGSPAPLNAETLFSVIREHYAAFPDWHHEVEDVMGEGEKVTVRVMQYGTHKAVYSGIPATGNKVQMAALHVGRIVNGRIKDWFAVEDYLGLMTQLGMELKPKAPDNALRSSRCSRQEEMSPAG